MPKTNQFETAGLRARATLAETPATAVPASAREQRSSTQAERPQATNSGPERWQWVVILVVWAVLFLASCGTPPLLDDADATHAQAAQAMLRTGDWVTLHVDGIRYLEKPPLPYWIAAATLRVFGDNAFAIHLPLALAVLGLALLGRRWAVRAYGRGRAPFYAAIFTLTAAGVFLFTRIFIPEALLSLLLAAALYCVFRLYTPQAGAQRPLALYAHAFWLLLALAVLTKGLIALVFPLVTAALFLLLTGEFRAARKLVPLTGLLLFLAIAAPWHILAGLRNTGGMNGHGFFWFYFINEHVLRFLGRRIPRDYNKLPAALYWSLHLVWLFPWSLFAPTAAVLAWRRFRRATPTLHRDSNLLPPLPWLLALMALGVLPVVAGGGLTTAVLLGLGGYGLLLVISHRLLEGKPWFLRDAGIQDRSTLLLSLFAGLILVFFALSTNQEYYTFPLYLPLLLLLAGCVNAAEQRSAADGALRRTLLFAHAALTVLGLAIAATLFAGLWSSRHLPFFPDIGSLLAHRSVGNYTLSMSHFFDLTGPSFAALRLPAGLACAAFALGPALGWILRRRASHTAATASVAATAAVFLIAAHIALVRFSPMLSSQSFAATIERLAATHQVAPDTQILLFGDQAYGSSLPFYLRREVSLVDGRSTSMLFGSTFPDALPVFVTSTELASTWGHRERKLLFVPLEHRDDVARLLGEHVFLLQETSGKALLTDRPLDAPTPADMSLSGAAH